MGKDFKGKCKIVLRASRRFLYDILMDFAVLEKLDKNVRTGYYCFLKNAKTVVENFKMRPI